LLDVAPLFGERPAGPVDVILLGVPEREPLTGQVGPQNAGPDEDLVGRGEADSPSASRATSNSTRQTGSVARCLSPQISVHHVAPFSAMSAVLS